MVPVATFADKPTLRGERVLLRPLLESDAADLLATMDEEGIRLTGTHRSFSLDDLIAWTSSRATVDDRLDLAIVDSSTNAFVGDLAINDWDPHNHSCNFRIALGPRGRNRGLGSEATRLIVDYVFANLPIHRIGLDVFSFNPRAAYVYERVGFVVEGTLRSTLFWEGRYYDSVLMSILRPEWEALRISSKS